LAHTGLFSKKYTSEIPCQINTGLITGILILKNSLIRYSCAPVDKIFFEVEKILFSIDIQYNYNQYLTATP